MTTATTTTKAATKQVADNVTQARAIYGDATKTLTQVGKAYVSGVVEMTKALGGFGREVLTETKDHAESLIKAKCLREVAERQTAFVQHRVEMTATHTKEFADLARVKTQEVIAPVTDLISNTEKAA